MKSVIEIGMNTYKNKKYVDKRLSAWKTVRIMESMPDKIQYIDGKTCHEKQQKSTINCLLPHPDLSAAQIQKEEQQHRHTTVQIRPVIQSDLCLYDWQMSGDHIKNREIGSHRLWEIHISGRRHL